MEPNCFEISSCITKLFEVVSENEFQHAKLIFRGVNYEESKREDYNGIRSRAAIHLNSLDLRSQSEFIKYHVDMLSNARKNGFGYDEERRISLEDLELLAEIQHNGGATCLTDFTKNFLVALWFACFNKSTSLEKINREIYIINLNSDMFKQISELEIKSPIENILRFNVKNSGGEDNNCEIGEFKPKFWCWDPGDSINRKFQQENIFIFGLDHVNESYYKTVTLDDINIDKVLDELRLCFNITEERLFQDIVGFSQAYRVKKEMDFGDRWLYDIGLSNYFRCDYSSAITYFTNFIENQTDDGKTHLYRLQSDAYYFRGVSYYKIGKKVKAKSDCNYVIVNQNCSQPEYTYKAKIVLANIEYDNAISHPIANHNDVYNSYAGLISYRELYKENNKIFDLVKRVSTIYLNLMEIYILFRPDCKDTFEDIHKNALTAICYELGENYVNDYKYVIYEYLFNLKSIIEFDPIKRNLEINLNKLLARRDFIDKIEKDNLKNRDRAFYWNFNDIRSWLQNQKVDNKMALYELKKQIGKLETIKKTIDDKSNY